MLSFSQLLWRSADLSQYQDWINRLRSEVGVSLPFAEILVARNLIDPLQVETFLHPKSEHCHDPFLLKDIRKAVDRIYQALVHRERIVIYGDYDVDGTFATVLLYKYLKRIGARAHYFIPDRLKDGYGLTCSNVRMLKRQKTDLIITVDNGSTAVEEAQLVRQLGMDLIITDHHQLSLVLPNTHALINPQQANCQYPFKGLCGTGVAYKLVQALDLYFNEKDYWNLTGCFRPNIKKYMDLVAFATIADRMPLVDENRFLVVKGIQQFNADPKPGLLALMRECKIRGDINPNIISHKLAPKINAAGRLSDPRTGIRLLLANSQYEARIHAKELMEVNSERQMIEYDMLQSAFLQADEQSGQKVIILVNKNWHPGVIGSVAAKVANRFKKPTLALTLFHDQFVGSVRSVDNLDVCSALQNCAELLDKFGGHKAAAGLSLLTKNLNSFSQKFQDLFEAMDMMTNAVPSDQLLIDTWITTQDLDAHFQDEMNWLSPFGNQNPEPIIGVKNAQLKRPSVFGNNHLRFQVGGENSNFEVFAWDHSEWYSKLKGSFDLAVSPQFTCPNGESTALQFKVMDIRQPN